MKLLEFRDSLTFLTSRQHLEIDFLEPICLNGLAMRCHPYLGRLQSFQRSDRDENCIAVVLTAADVSVVYIDYAYLIANS